MPPPGKARETVDDTGTIAEPSDGESDVCQGPSPAPRNFPTVEPKKRKIANLDEAKYEEGYDSDGNLPYYFDYEGDEDEDEEDNAVEEQADEEDKADEDRVQTPTRCAANKNTTIKQVGGAKKSPQGEFFAKLVSF